MTLVSGRRSRIARGRLGSIHIGKAKVDQVDVSLVAGCMFHCRFSVLEQRDHLHVGLQLEQDRQGLPELAIVVDDRDAHMSSRTHRRSVCATVPA